MSARRHIARRGRLAQHPAPGAHGKSNQDQGQRRSQQQREAHQPGRNHADHQCAPPIAHDGPSGPGGRYGAGQVGEKHRAQQGGGEIVGRRCKAEAHIGENRDEVEQHAEADGAGRHELQIAEMAQHLPARGHESLRAHEALLPWQFRCHQDGARKPNCRNRQKGVTPAGDIADDARDQAAAEATEARCRNIKPGNTRDFGRRPLIADIGKHDRKNRRQAAAPRRSARR